MVFSSGVEAVRHIRAEIKKGVVRAAIDDGGQAGCLFKVKLKVAPGPAALFSAFTIPP
jgi:hypothetical protein